MATNLPLGVQEVIGFGREGTYGTASSPAAVRWFRPVSNGLQRKRPAIEPQGPSGGMWGRYDSTRPRVYRGAPVVSGTVVLELEYDDIGYLFSTLIGDPTSTADSPVAGAYTHVWTAGSAVPTNTPTSLSIAHLNGQEDLLYTGCVIQSMSIAATPTEENDGIVTVSLEIVGQDGGEAEVDDATTEGFSSAPFTQWKDTDFRYHATVGTASASLASQTGGACPLSATWGFVNPYRIGPAAAKGTAGIREPVFNGKRESSLAVTRDFFDDEFFDKYHSANVTGMFAASALKFTSSENITGATPYSLDLYSPAALIQDQDSTYGGGAGIREETINFMAFNDGSNNPITVTLVNGTTNAAGAAYGGSQS